MSTELNLYGSRIADKGIQRLFDVLKGNIYITNLNLYGNETEEIRGGFLSDALQVNKEIEDVVNDFSNSILLPKLLQKKEDINIERYKGILAEQTREVLFKGLSREKIIQISELWHDPFSQTTLLKSKDYSGADWESLFMTKRIDVPDIIMDSSDSGWKVVCLTNLKELKKEGEILSHCVGGYTSRCFS